MTVGCRGHLVLLLEEFDEVRRVGKGAFITDFGDGFRRRNEQQARMHQPLPDVPLVWRHLEMAAELFLERGQRTVGEFGELLDRNVLEDMVVDGLFEILPGAVDIAQQLAFDAAVFV